MKRKCFSSTDSTREVILLSLPNFATKIRMEINVPNDRDPEEYIEEMIDFIFNENIIYDIDWDFA